MLTSTIEALPFPPTLVFPDVDPDVLADEGRFESETGANPWSGFLRRLLATGTSFQSGSAPSSC